MIGAFEYARKAGVLDAIAVIDPVMNRVLKRSGNAPYDYLGSAKPMGKVTAMAALMDCSDTRISSVRAFSNITHDVFATEDAALVRFSQRARLHSAETQDDTASPQIELHAELDAYFAEQMKQADSPAEVDSVRRLMDAVTGLRTQDSQRQVRTLH